jgi:hypothetical protein
MLSTCGELEIKRVYRRCSSCTETIHPTDDLLGLKDRYTVGLRDMAVFAGIESGGFAKAQKRLQKLSGIEIAENTIKTLCDKESVKMKKWQENDPQSWSAFDAAEGEIEFTTDGTSVNTTEGWREARVGMFSKREPGEPAMPLEWATRHLPRPHVTIAFAEIAEKDVFRMKWRYWLNRLDIKDTSVISVLADAAPWIWDSSLLEFGNAQEVLDIYHALEYVAAKGDMLFSKGSPEYTVWCDTTKRDLLDGGAWPVLERTRLMDSEDASKEQKEAIRLLSNYLEKHTNRMNYRERLASGLSIGSGQVEGACKHLIGARLKQTGAKWRVERVNRMGVLCSVLYGEQWDDYWKCAN